MQSFLSIINHRIPFAWFPKFVMCQYAREVDGPDLIVVEEQRDPSPNLTKTALYW